MSSAKQTNSRSEGIIRRIAWGCTAVLIVFCLVGGVFSAFGDRINSYNIVASPTSQGADLVVFSTWTPEPLPAAETEPELRGLLSGLSPQDVTVSLEQRQFTCTAVRKVVYYERTCKREEPSVYLFNVDIVGREPFIVDFIDTAILQFGNPDNEIAASLLGFVAAMPYDSATPEDARAWVEITLPLLTDEPGDAEETEFGGVKYTLFGSPTALTLEMGELLPIP